MLQAVEKTHLSIIKEIKYEIMKKVNINESQYDGLLKKFELDKNEKKKKPNKEELAQIDNQFLGIEVVDVKDTARKMISKAFNMGIEYGKNPMDIYLRRKIKEKLDDMIQAVDGDKLL